MNLRQVLYRARIDSVSRHDRKHRTSDDALTVDVNPPFRRALFVFSLKNVETTRIHGTKNERLEAPKGSEGELQFRQIFGYLAGELRAELIEVRVAALDTVNEMSDRRLASRGGNLALKSRKTARFNLLSAGRIDPRHGVSTHRFA